MAILKLHPRSRAGSLAIQLLTTILITLAVNGLVFGLGWAGASADVGRHNWLLPPGWVVGTVWLVLLALVAAAY